MGCFLEEVAGLCEELIVFGSTFSGAWLGAIGATGQEIVSETMEEPCP